VKEIKWQLKEKADIHQATQSGQMHYQRMSSPASVAAVMQPVHFIITWDELSVHDRSRGSCHA